MAQHSISFTDLRINLCLIGQDRWWRETPCLHQRFTIKDPPEIEAKYLPLTYLNVIHKPERGRTIRNVRHAVQKDLAVESVLRQVSA